MKESSQCRFESKEAAHALECLQKARELSISAKMAADRAKEAISEFCKVIGAKEEEKGK